MVTTDSELAVGDHDSLGEDWWQHHWRSRSRYHCTGGKSESNLVRLAVTVALMQSVWVIQPLSNDHILSQDVDELLVTRPLLLVSKHQSIQFT